MSREHNLPELIGWLFSVYPDQEDGAVIWIIAEDGERYRLRQPYATTFYLAARAAGDLNIAAKYLGMLKDPPMIDFVVKRDLFKGHRRVLQVTCTDPVSQQRLFYTLQKRFKHIQFYNAKIPFPVRFGGETGSFPMAKCRMVMGEAGQVARIDVLDSPWDFSYELPPLRELIIQPDTDPTYKPPSKLSLRLGESTWEFGTDKTRDLLLGVIEILDEHDPDVILAVYGDGWLFPYLMDIAEKHAIDFNPNRDKRKKPIVKDELTYHSYGQVHYRAAQTMLFGRWHVDPGNAAMTGGFSLHAAVEMARVSSVDVQIAARNSPGAGFTAMQMRQALHWGTLVPLKKRQTEPFRALMALNDSDGGGLNYHPVVGLHFDVAELDFFSMYPSIMAEWNISGETAGEQGRSNKTTPRSGMPITQDTPGLVA